MDVRLRGLFGREQEDALRALRLEAPEPPADTPAATIDVPNDAALDLVADAAREARGRPREGSPAAEVHEERHRPAAE